METMSKLMIFGMVILLSCSEKTKMDPIYEPTSVTFPFSATYMGYNALSDQSSQGCVPGFNHTVEIADGNGTFVGFSTFHSDYCSSTGTINPGRSFIMTQNGDTLYITYSGKTCVGLGRKELECKDHVNEICCWEIPFTILGGTGAFEGAMGSGTTNDYFSTGNTYYHSWKGTITVRSENLQELQ